MQINLAFKIHNTLTPNTLPQFPILPVSRAVSQLQQVTPYYSGLLLSCYCCLRGASHLERTASFFLPSPSPLPSRSSFRTFLGFSGCGFCAL